MIPAALLLVIVLVLGIVWHGAGFAACVSGREAENSGIAEIERIGPVGSFWTEGCR